VTIATDGDGRQQTCTDDLPQATCARALVIRTATWLRDEEAASTAESDRSGSRRPGASSWKTP